MQRIETQKDIATAIDMLVGADKRLAAIRDFAGEVPLRRTAPGFRSLASVIVSQQVSRASAEAIFGRLASLADPLTAEGLACASEDLFRQAGLSRPKQKALLAICEAVAQGLDLERVGDMAAEEAIARLIAVPGIGPWTAEVYLLSAAGHPDIFPAGDVALQAAVMHGFGLPLRPDQRQLRAIAESWRPWRSVAARLWWAYYGRLKDRAVAPM